MTLHVSHKQSFAGRSLAAAFGAAALLALTACGESTADSAAPAVAAGSAPSASAPQNTGASKTVTNGGKATKADVLANPDFGRPGDVVVGDPNAPVSMIEYASLTCSHCAHFEEEIFPILKEKFIDTGLLKYTLREFPVGPPAAQALATQAFMVSRCRGDEHFYKMTNYLFKRQEDWAFSGTISEAAEKLKTMARSFGIGEEKYKECTSDQAELDRIQATAEQGADVHKITGTPGFVINNHPLEVVRNSFGRATHLEIDGRRYDLPTDAERLTEVINSYLPDDKKVK